MDALIRFLWMDAMAPDHQVTDLSDAIFAARLAAKMRRRVAGSLADWKRRATALAVDPRVPDNVGSVMFALCRQDPNEWDDVQADAVLAFLRQWSDCTEFDRRTFEAWYDALVDSGVHVRPW